LIYEDELEKMLEKCPPRLKSFITKENNIFERSIFEHNLLSLSQIYENISFTSLEKFLRYDIDKILNLTFKMILENKINAKIDEVNKFIYFEPEPSNSLIFDKQIQNFSLKVLHLADYIKKKSA
jgi:hypothetical protein